MGWRGETREHVELTSALSTCSRSRNRCLPKEHEDKQRSSEPQESGRKGGNASALQARVTS